MTLRARIVALGAGSAAAVLVLLAVPVSIATFDNAEDEAEQDAVTLVRGVTDYISTGSATRANLEAVIDRANDDRPDTPVTAVLADGTRLGATMPDCAVSSVEDDGSDADRGGRGDGLGGRDGEELLPVSEVRTDRVDDGTLVVAVVESDGGVVVCGLVQEDVVRAAVAESLGPLAAAGAVIFAVVVLLALWVARRLARHLTVVASTADQLRSGDLSARAPDGGPAEVGRVAIALNRLADRIDELLVLERETVADLSHRLRTPLMAVRLDVEALPPSETRDELDAHVTHLERTLTTVIQAARRPVREGAATACDATQVVRERFDYWSPLLEDQGRTTSLILHTDSSAALVRCSRDDLTAALDALLENAVAHTPEGTAVEVETSATADGRVQVDVRDQGPGVPPEALLRGRSDRGSSGLGLDIARSCAESSGGGLELLRDDEWSVVRLALGPV